jgi:hypothetical protein
VITFDGRELNWSAVKTAPFEKKRRKENENKLNTVVPVSFPNIAFGNTEN